MVSLLRLGLPATFLVFLTITIANVVSQQCFYPNGNIEGELDVPCSSGNGVACCPVNWTCLSNGLCHLANQNFYGRYTCSDKTWKASGCPNFCTKAPTNSNNFTAAGNEAVLRCPDGRYCCDGDRSFNCCQKAGTAFFGLPDGNIIATITGASQFPAPTKAPAKSSPMGSSSVTAAHSSLLAGNGSLTALTSSLSTGVATGRSDGVHPITTRIPTANDTSAISSDRIQANKAGLIAGVTLGSVCTVLGLLLVHFCHGKIRNRRNLAKLDSGSPDMNDMNGLAAREHLDHGKTRWWISPFGTIRRPSNMEVLPLPSTQPMGESPGRRGFVELPANEAVVAPSAYLEPPSQHQQPQQPVASYNPTAFAQANSLYPRHSTHSTFSAVSALEPEPPQSSSPATATSPQASTLPSSAPDLRAPVVQIGSWPNSPNAPPFAVIDASAGALHVPDSPSYRMSLATSDMYGRILGGHNIRSSYASSGSLLDSPEGAFPIRASNSVVAGMEPPQDVFELPAGGEPSPRELPGSPVRPRKN